MIIGIDLGTTNSLVSVWRDGKPEVIPNALNQPLTPSVVGLDDEGRIITGQPAKERLITHPQLTVANVKRYMGSDHEFKLGKQSFRPEELSALILRSLKADAEAFLGESVSEAVITVPAYFNDSQRKATRAAGELAGFRVERLLNEPTAAALAYGLHHKNDQRYLIFDLGGGTFDVSIVEYFDGMLEVHASAGDNFLGGEDFVEAIITDFAGANKTEYPWLEKHDTNPVLQQTLWRTAEFLKRQLSEHTQSEANFVYDNNQVTWRIDESRFEKISEPLLNRIAEPIRRALRDAKFKVSDLNEIVMVGGATRMPVIRKLATKLFQRFPAFDIDPDQVVVVGAAIQAGLKARDEALDDTVMTDVCPYSLGIEVSQGDHENLQHGYFLPIIERNNFIPVSRVETVYTASDRQTRIEVNIYQGESVMVKDNIYLGQLNADVPKAPRGEEAIDVRFTYDINGLLEVEVTIKSTDKKHSKTIEKNPGLLTEEEIRTRLKKLERLKIHPRDLLPNQALINRANRIYQEVLGDARQVLSQGLSDFLAILDRQDDREIRNARKDFEQFLNEIETYTFH